jgi:hypothetical protein
MNTVPPIRREVLVDADPAIAFEVFTAGIGRWWPLAELSVHGADATVAFVDGQIVERSGETVAVWGTVTRWEPSPWRSPGIPGGCRNGPARLRSPSSPRRAARW